MGCAPAGVVLVAAPDAIADGAALCPGVTCVDDGDSAGRPAKSLAATLTAVVTRVAPDVAGRAAPPGM